MDRYGRVMDESERTVRRTDSDIVEKLVQNRELYYFEGTHDPCDAKNLRSADSGEIERSTRQRPALTNTALPPPPPPINL